MSQAANKASQSESYAWQIPVKNTLLIEWIWRTKLWILEVLLLSSFAQRSYSL